jgi:C4-dicarboxylate transporter DctQ subunit
MFLRILDRLEEILIATLMALATFIIFLAVMHRYLVGIPLLYPLLFPINLSWAQELCIYMFVWVAKFGAAYGVRTGIHVGVDVLVNQLKSPWRNIVVLFGLFCGAFFTAVIGTMGAKFVIGLMYTDQVSPDLEIPSWFVYLHSLGSYLRWFLRSVTPGAPGELPHHDRPCRGIGWKCSAWRRGGRAMSACSSSGFDRNMLTACRLDRAGMTVLTFIYTATAPTDR